MAVTALGMVETSGLTAAIEAADIILKKDGAALIGKYFSGGNFFTVFAEGDFEDVKSAIEAGAESAGKLGKLIGYCVIPKPHPGLKNLFF